jgi:hypothetical protein
MPYSRNSVLTGQTIILRVIFRDDANNLINADTVPDLYIYDPSVDTDVIDAEITAATFTSALAGPLVPTALSTGFYEYSYVVPSGGTEGVWRDVWVAEVDGVASTEYFPFNVDVGADLSIQQLFNNELIIVELDTTIGNVGATATLVADTTLAFSTVYSPLYASPDLVRMEVGTFIDYIPDDTLALMIHWSSKEADFIAKPIRCKVKEFNFARTKFVVYDAAIRAIMLPGGSNGLPGSTGGDSSKKQLGDLMIDKSGTSSGSTVAITSSGIDIDTLNDLRSKRDEWWRVTNAGGCIVPGQSFDPATAQKGKCDPDRRIGGRLWSNPEYTSYPQPGANTKVVRSGSIRGRWAFSRNRRGFPYKRRS